MTIANFGGKQAAPFGSKKRAQSAALAAARKRLAKKRRKSPDLATYGASDIELDWAAWDKAHPWPGHEPKSASKSKKTQAYKGNKPIPAGLSGKAKELAQYQSHWGLTPTGVLDARTAAALRKMSTQKGHLRAKALLAGTSGNTTRADAIEKAWHSAGGGRKSSFYAAKKSKPKTGGTAKKTDLAALPAGAGRDIALATLTAKARKALPSSAFVFPGARKYPIHDAAHARNALARSAGKPEAAAVKAAVRKRFPSLALSAASDRDIALGKDGSEWKHGYIPQNAAALALKMHKTPGVGGSASAEKRFKVGSRTKSLSDITFRDLPKMSDKDVREIGNTPNHRAQPAAMSELDHRKVSKGELSNRNFGSMTNEDKIKAAEKMHGTGSKQHLDAIRRFSKPAGKPDELKKAEQYHDKKISDAIREHGLGSKEHMAAAQRSGSTARITAARNAKLAMDVRHAQADHGAFSVEHAVAMKNAGVDPSEQPWLKSAADHKLTQRLHSLNLSGTHLPEAKAAIRGEQKARTDHDNEVQDLVKRVHAGSSSAATELYKRGEHRALAAALVGHNAKSGYVKPNTSAIPAKAKSLDKAEKEWLGQSIRLPDGRTGQVSSIGKGNRLHVVVKGANGKNEFVTVPVPGAKKVSTSRAQPGLF